MRTRLWLKFGASHLELMVYVGQCPIVHSADFSVESTWMLSALMPSYEISYGLRSWKKRATW
jgi:hypothetical protein